MHVYTYTQARQGCTSARVCARRQRHVNEGGSIHARGYNLPLTAAHAAGRRAAEAAMRRAMRAAFKAMVRTVVRRRKQVRADSCGNVLSAAGVRGGAARAYKHGMTVEATGSGHVETLNKSARHQPATTGAHVPECGQSLSVRAHVHAVPLCTLVRVYAARVPAHMLPCGSLRTRVTCVMYRALARATSSLPRATRAFSAAAAAAADLKAAPSATAPKVCARCRDVGAVLTW